MLIDLFFRAMIIMIFISGSTVISYYATRLLAFLIPSTLISDIFLWSGTVIFSALLLMGSAYVYVYRGFGTQTDIIRRLPEPGNRVAITFDDGPSELYTSEILDVLKEKNAKATFFMVGMQAEKNPDLVKRIVEEGHEVGNHTYGHITVPNSPAPRLAAQIMRTNFAILQHGGVYPQFLRPPRGMYDMRLRRLAGLLGQNLVLWSLSSQDWHPRATLEGIVRRVVERASAGDIILFHDSGSLLGKDGANRSHTVEALGPVIDGLRSKGLEITGLEETIKSVAI